MRLQDTIRRPEKSVFVLCYLVRRFCDVACSMGSRQNPRKKSILKFDSFHVTRKEEIASGAARDVPVLRSVNGSCLALHVVHQQILAEVVRCGEVGFSLAHLRDLLDELDEAVVCREHEGVDHYAGAFALVDFLERFADDKGVKAKGVFVDAAFLERQGGGFAVRNHDDLTHVFALAKKDALGHAKAFARVGVKRADLDPGELAEGNFFGRIVKENEAQSVARILRADQVGESHRDTLGRSEAIFAVKNHAVTAIKQKDRRTRTLVFALVDGEVAVLQVDGNFDAVAANGVRKCLANIEIENVAEFIGA